MDVSNFRRSENIDDDRTDEVTKFFNLLTSPMQMSYHDLMNHPFQRPYDFYEQLYLKNNQPLTPDQYTPLARQAGIADVDPFVRALRGQK